MFINRIERLWKDVRSKVIEFYMNLFKKFERQGMDIDNIVHIYTLQYMFMPRIQADLDSFKLMWNHHPVSTEHNLSPIQMLLLRANSFAPNVVPNDYGVEGIFEEDDDGLENEIHVECNPLRCPLTPENVIILKIRINPLTLQTPLEDLAPWYYSALQIVNELHDSQQ